VRCRFDPKDQGSHRVFIFSRKPIIVFGESECRVRSIERGRRRGGKAFHVDKATRVRALSAARPSSAGAFAREVQGHHHFANELDAGSFKCPSNDLSLGLFPVGLPQAYPGPAAVLVNELDASCLQRAPNRQNVWRCEGGLMLGEFSTPDRAQAYG